MKVELVSHTPNPLEVIYRSARQCYSMRGYCNIRNTSNEEMSKFVSDLLAGGHESPLEHVTFTYAITGVSRALSHQLVRHRIASYSQQSQRYVEARDFDFVVPPSLDEDGKKYFELVMDTIAIAYDSLIQAGVAPEDARYVLPNAACTKIVVTMNARTLIHFFSERLCTRAQWEIRGMASRMYTKAKKVLPEVFTAGAKCFRLGYCPELEKFCCGIKKPLTKD